MSKTYETPQVTKLGTVSELTEQAPKTINGADGVIFQVPGGPIISIGES